MNADFVDNLMKRLAAQGGRGLRLETGQPAQMLDGFAVFEVHLY